jgi:hypothetical protein
LRHRGISLSLSADHLEFEDDLILPQKVGGLFASDAPLLDAVEPALSYCPHFRIARTFVLYE